MRNHSVASSARHGRRSKKRRVAAQEAAAALRAVAADRDAVEADYDRRKAALADLMARNAAQLPAVAAQEDAFESAAGAQLGAGGQVAGFMADPRALAAVQHALRQLGKPYEWAAEGPNSYDRSGLVWDAYRTPSGSACHGSPPTSTTRRQSSGQRVAAGRSTVLRPTRSAAGNLAHGDVHRQRQDGSGADDRRCGQTFNTAVVELLRRDAGHPRCSCARNVASGLSAAAHIGSAGKLSDVVNLAERVTIAVGLSDSIRRTFVVVILRAVPVLILARQRQCGCRIGLLIRAVNRREAL